MWQLLLNGLSVAGSLASLHSFAAGFSVEKNIAQIQESAQRLETLYTELLKDSRVNKAILNYAAPFLSRFAELNPDQQRPIGKLFSPIH